MGSNNAGKRSLPSLDGLRAVAVTLVLLDHSHSPWLDRVRFNPEFRNGRQGVAVFFVLSGFLITYLLLQEQKKTGTIKLGLFYFRRTFRIFPAFYFYLGVIALLALGHVVRATPLQFAAAATYTWNFLPYGKGTWELGHLWSLAIEEHFYLFWPACMLFLSRRANLRLALAMIVLSPVFRAFIFFYAPQLHVLIYVLGSFDLLMAGCALALVLDLDLWPSLVRVLQTPWMAALAVGTLIVIDTPLVARSSFYEPVLSTTLRSCVMPIIVLFCLRRPDSVPGKVLNWRWVSRFGQISYSVYLWQQVYILRQSIPLPLRWLLILITAELSFRFIEQPGLRLRERLASRFWPTSSRVSAVASARLIQDA